MKPEWQPGIVRLAANITKFITNESISEKSSGYRAIATSASATPAAVDVELKAARKTVSKIRRSKSGRIRKRQNLKTPQPH